MLVLKLLASKDCPKGTVRSKVAYAPPVTRISRHQWQLTIWAHTLNLHLRVKHGLLVTSMTLQLGCRLHNSVVTARLWAYMPTRLSQISSYCVALMHARVVLITWRLRERLQASGSSILRYRQSTASVQRQPDLHHSSASINCRPTPLFHWFWTSSAKAGPPFARFIAICIFLTTHHSSTYINR